MSSFLIGNLGLLLEELGADLPQEAEQVLVALREVGLLHGLDEFCCFKAFEGSRVEFRIHRVFSAEHYCSVCGTLQAGLVRDKCRQRGCGGILAPTIATSREAVSQAPYYPDDWCKADEAIEDRLDISMHKSER